MTKGSTGTMISVITPAYNAEAVIGETIDSVIAQTYTNWEMIIVDDCSTDNTQAIVQRYARSDQRIKLIALDQNHGGPAAPRNVGIRAANGEWIAFLDSDDIWHPKKLEIQLSALQRVNASFCSTQMKDFTNTSHLSFPSPTNITYKSISFKGQQVRFRTPTSSVIAKRDLMIKFSFNEDARYKAVEDYHCWLRIHQNIKTSIKINYPLMFYRRTDGQISGSKTKMLKRVLMVHKEYPGNSHVHALLFTATHLLGGLYYRLWRKEL